MNESAIKCFLTFCIKNTSLHYKNDHKINVMTEFNASDYVIACQVDARNTRCPIPLLRAKQALKGLQTGDYLQVLATDPTAKGDFDAMLKHLPHTLVAYDNGDEFDTFVIHKGDLNLTDNVTNNISKDLT